MSDHISMRKVYILWLKDPFPGLRQFLETERPLKMMKNAFYFTLKAFFVLTFLVI